ncbi:MAG: alpha-amylase family glycosyl hydrolase [Bradymonadia bacterium]
MSCTVELKRETNRDIDAVEVLLRHPDHTITKKSLTQRTPTQWELEADASSGLTYLFLEDSQPELDPTRPLSMEIDGQMWSYIPPTQCNAPEFDFVTREVRNERTYLTLQMKRSHSNHGLDADSVYAEVDGTSLTTIHIGDQVLVDITSLPQGKHWLSLTANDVHNRSSKPFKAPFWVESKPFRWSTAQMYQVVTDRFAGFQFPAPQDWTIGTYRGGNWQGIQTKIETGYFEQFGIDTLWISPVNQNPDGLWVGVEGGVPRYEGYHGYWRVSNNQINDHFGSDRDLRQLIKSAHQNGIRVIVDVVLNHRHIQYDRPNSSSTRSNSLCICGHAICPWWSDIERCWFTSYLPDIDYSVPDVLETELNELRTLLTEFDFDGVRVDAVPMMPRFVIRHLKHMLTETFEGLDSRFVSLGETFTHEDGYDQIRYYLGKHGLDGQFDFPLMWAVRAFFAEQRTGADELLGAWRRSHNAWRGSGSSMALMIGNHDIPRFTSIANYDAVYDPWGAPPIQSTNQEIMTRSLNAQTFLLSLPGIWTLYYGDEVGLSGGQDPDNRRPFPWENVLSPAQLELNATLGQLARNRHCIAPRLSEDVLFTALDEKALAVIRTDKQTGKPTLVVVLSSGALPRLDAIHSLREHLKTHASWTDIVSGTRFSGTDENLDILIGNGNLRWLVPSNDVCATRGEL